MAVLPEQLIVNIHQFALADCGRRLFGGNIRRTGAESKLSGSHADGA